MSHLACGLDLAGSRESVSFLAGLHTHHHQLRSVRNSNICQYDSDDNYTFQQMLGVCGTSLVLPGWLALGVTVGMGDVFRQ